MISDRKGIKEFWPGLIEAVNADSAALESVDLILAGDGAVEIGRATLSLGSEGQSRTQIVAG
jgi:hypothetical protein